MGKYIYHGCRGYMHTYVTQDGNPSKVLHKAIMENTANSKVKGWKEVHFRLIHIMIIHELTE